MKLNNRRFHCEQINPPSGKPALRKIDLTFPFMAAA